MVGTRTRKQKASSSGQDLEGREPKGLQRDDFLLHPPRVRSPVGSPTSVRPPQIRGLGCGFVAIWRCPAVNDASQIQVRRIIKRVVSPLRLWPAAANPNEKSVACPPPSTIPPHRPPCSAWCSLDVQAHRKGKKSRVIQSSASLARYSSPTESKGAFT